jgi:hypothetical protein
VLGRELRLVYSPGAGAATGVHDGASAAALTETALTVTGGGEYQVFTLDVDGRTLAAPWSAPAAVSVDGTDLPSVANVTTCGAPGCFHFTAATKRLEVRVFAPAGQTRAVAVR